MDEYLSLFFLVFTMCILFLTIFLVDECLDLTASQFVFIYSFLYVLVVSVNVILEVCGVWESASVYVLQLLS